MKSQILSYINRTLALIHGEDRGVELEFLRAARDWSEGMRDAVPVLNTGAILFRDSISDICRELSASLTRARDIEPVRISLGMTGELEWFVNETFFQEGLDWVENLSDPNTLLEEVQAAYPGDWKVNEDSRWVYMVVGDQLSVVLSRGLEKADLTVFCILQSFVDDDSDAYCSDMDSIPMALADAIVQVVATPTDLKDLITLPTFDPMLIPDWLKGPLKEALRPEHERIDRMFQGL